MCFPSNFRPKLKSYHPPNPVTHHLLSDITKIVGNLERLQIAFVGFVGCVYGLTDEKISKTRKTGET